MASEPLVELKGVDKTYYIGKIPVPALKETTLSIEKGEFIVVLGPSGSGKTTMLNLIGGLDSATSGEVKVESRDLSDLTEKQLTEFRRTGIGFIFQFFNLIPTLTALENVSLASQLAGRDNVSSEKVLEEVGLKGREHHFPNQLSGGEQQRVAVARALAKEAPLMLCDEPTGELDYETGKKILKLLRRLNQERKRTFIVVTHNVAIGEIADRIIKLRDGEIVFDEQNQEILDPEKLKW